jgi:hypothetical protein
MDYHHACEFNTLENIFTGIDVSKVKLVLLARDIDVLK